MCCCFAGFRNFGITVFRLLFNFVYCVQVTGKAFEVEAVADDELVGDTANDVVGFGIGELEFIGFAEQGCYANGGGALVQQVALKVVHGKAGIHYIFDNDDVAAFYVLL